MGDYRFLGEDLKPLPRCGPAIVGFIHALSGCWEERRGRQGGGRGVGRYNVISV